MRTVLLIAAIGLGSMTSAMAGDEVLASRFGNTTITKDASGMERHIYYAADHTLTGKQGALAFEGTWKIDGTTICITFDPALPNTPNPTCVPVADHKIGDTWTAGPYTVSLVSGIQ